MQPLPLALRSDHARRIAASYRRRDRVANALVVFALLGFVVTVVLGWWVQS